MAVPSSSSQDAAEVREVRESSAPRAGKGNVSMAEMIRKIRLILGDLNKSILSLPHRLIGFRRTGLQQGSGVVKGERVYSSQFTVHSFRNEEQYFYNMAGNLKAAS